MIAKPPGRAVAGPATVANRSKAVMKPMVLAYVATSLHKAGDHAGARMVIEQASRLANELPEQREKQGSMAHIARAMAVTGNMDGALELTRILDKHGSQSAIEEIVDSFTEDERGEAWLPTAGSRSRSGLRRASSKIARQHE